MKRSVDSVYDATRAFDKNRKVNVYLEEEKPSVLDCSEPR